MVIYDAEKYSTQEEKLAALDRIENSMQEFFGDTRINRLLLRGKMCGHGPSPYVTTAYRSVYDALDTISSWYKDDNVFADCKITRIEDFNGELKVQGDSIEGGCSMKIRQLTDEGEKAVSALGWHYGIPCFHIPYDGVTAMGKTYTRRGLNQFLSDVWENPKLCPLSCFGEFLAAQDGLGEKDLGARAEQVSLVGKGITARKGAGELNRDIPREKTPPINFEEMFLQEF